jgi:bifunctional NMN adenylyltransferase/nudix hydrolase
MGNEKDMEKKTEIGVLIGRFQVHELHAAHRDLFERVLANHKKVIVFLGCAQVIGSRKNPLDFPTRKSMVESTYSGRISAILPIYDNRSDANWSREVDRRIREVFPMGDVTLYGSRDSFIPHYQGAFKTCELDTKVFLSGTEVRKNVSEEILQTPEFRAGVIYANYNRYPIIDSTVDLAIFNNDETELLLARKPTDPVGKHRFVGGFVDMKDENDFAACRREGREETSAEIEPYEYVCSHTVLDWRYRTLDDRKIMTRLFKCKHVSGRIQPADDISELQWFKIQELNADLMVPEHQPLMERLLSKILPAISKI